MGGREKEEERKREGRREEGRKVGKDKGQTHTLSHTLFLTHKILHTCIFKLKMDETISFLPNLLIPTYLSNLFGIFQFMLSP